MRGAAAVPTDLVRVMVRLSWWENAAPPLGQRHPEESRVQGQPRPAGTVKVLPAAPPRPEGFTLEFPLPGMSPSDDTRDEVGGGLSRVPLHTQGASGPA